MNSSADIKLTQWEALSGRELTTLYDGFNSHSDRGLARNVMLWWGDASGKPACPPYFDALRHKSRALLYYSQRDLVAWCAIIYDAQQDMNLINTFVTMPSRRQGIGKQLVERAVAMLRAERGPYYHVWPTRIYWARESYKSRTCEPRQLFAPSAPSARV